MMMESNNLLYHPGDGGFDRLEDMEGGQLARIPVLRSVPGPMPRPWATRGAITLLLVCGVVFGVIAIASMNTGSASTNAAETASGDPTSANVGGVTIANGSSSFTADNGVSGSTSTAESTLGSSAADKSENSSNDSSNDTSNEVSDSSSLATSNEASSDGSAVLAVVHGEGSTSGSNDSRNGSSFEEVSINSLDIWSGGSQSGSFEDSASDASESQSDSAGSEQDFLVSSSDSTDGSSEWLFDSVSGSQDTLLDDSASDAGWHSSSMDDETSDSLSRSEDSSLEF